MLIETEGGFDYTAADCMGWMTDAGFRSDACRAPDRAGLDGDRREVARRAHALEYRRQLLFPPGGARTNPQRAVPGDADRRLSHERVRSLLL